MVLRFPGMGNSLADTQEFLISRNAGIASCGTAPCANDADCGGGVGSCSAFIRCCAKGEGTLLSSGADKSSRKTELPALGKLQLTGNDSQSSAPAG